MRAMSLCFAPGNGRSAECRQRDEAITEAAVKDFEGQKKVIQLLLLGTGESGKSTVCKQMQIIHINGFSYEERREKLAYMRRNIRDSIACIVAAMDKLGIPFGSEEAAEMGAWLLQQMTDNQAHNASRADLDPFVYSSRFFRAAERLWQDPGVQESFRNSSRYQLIDCAKYFLDRIHLFKNKTYTPTDQDILRCRIMTNNITDIRFEIKDGNHTAKFRVYDVGGQKGERKKWIQCFNNVTAILYLCDVSSFDLTLKEDVGIERPKNRLLESLDTFQEVWLNRYLQDVSVLLFINKIDQLEEKIRAGKSLETMLTHCRQTIEMEATAATVAAADTAGSSHQNDNDEHPVMHRRRSCKLSTVPTVIGRASTATAEAASQKQKKKHIGPLDLVRFISQLDFDRFVPSEEERREFLDAFPRLEEMAAAAAAAAAANADGPTPQNGNGLQQQSPQQQVLQQKASLTNAPSDSAAASANTAVKPAAAVGGSTEPGKKKKRGKQQQQQQQDLPKVHPDTVKTACFVKNIF
uniref:Adenylate cyclase-stimulating G alpha protein n=2 Tax=Macrostomum lignano TaxID=282301 RepID=A0A1I8GDW6_9PLAT